MNSLSLLAAGALAYKALTIEEDESEDYMTMAQMNSEAAERLAQYHEELQSLITDINSPDNQISSLLQVSYMVRLAGLASYSKWATAYKVRITNNSDKEVFLAGCMLIWSVGGITADHVPYTYVRRTISPGQTIDITLSGTGHYQKIFGTKPLRDEVRELFKGSSTWLKARGTELPSTGTILLRVESHTSNTVVVQEKREVSGMVEYVNDSSLLPPFYNYNGAELINDPKWVVTKYFEND